MITFIYALAASSLIAVTSLSTRLVVWVSYGRLAAWLPWLQATAAGLLIGDALMHMLPEAMLRGTSAAQVGTLLAIGILLLLFVEGVMRAAVRFSAYSPFARMDVVGDALHHLVDGIVVGANFFISARLGLIVAIAIACHELPREIGNAGVLVAGGYKPRRAFALSLATTVATPFGALLFFLTGNSGAFLGRSLSLAAGTTIYLACSDVLPGIWQGLDSTRRQNFIPALGASTGVVFMWLAALLDRIH